MISRSRPLHEHSLSNTLATCCQSIQHLQAGSKKAVLQPSSSVNTSERAIEEIYQKKSQLEHILLRPDTYIGR